MRVKATRLGYYGHARRREGAVFNLESPEHFSERWMEALQPAQAKKAKPKDPSPEESETAETQTQSDQQLI